MTDLPQLRPGDCLLYKPSGFFGWLIALKTWNRISHVEIYQGNDKSVASRAGVGVGMYRTRYAGLARVLRPYREPLNLTAATHFFAQVNGQKYDWKGILCFTLAVAQGAKDKMFCSEFATRWYRRAGIPLFGNYDADHIAPAQFLMTDLLQEIWRADAGA